VCLIRKCQSGGRKQRSKVQHVYERMSGGEISSGRWESLNMSVSRPHAPFQALIIATCVAFQIVPPAYTSTELVCSHLSLPSDSPVNTHTEGAF
jgi:hypothetical protein